ncbi:eukaryotic translation initiation factor 2A [Dermatophagoides farinae]|uniref:eukaryotic translation initiation factor 2A n=1 Tax=Dermatophagoides farinae TaxID=6954 RepID=UPI003F639EFE
MAVAAKFIVHDSNGLHVWSTDGPNESADLLKTLDTGGQKPLNLLPSPDGQYLAIIFKDCVRVFVHDQMDKPTLEFMIESVKHVEFSPKSTMIMLFAPLAQQNPSPNLKVFDLTKNGQLNHEWTTKKRELVQWSADESIAHRQCGSEILFFENNDFNRCVQKISEPKLTTYGFTTNKAGCSFVAIYIKGQKGSPSMIRIHGFPHLDNAIVSKSFYKVDTVDIKWNPKGDAILAMTSTDYDSSGQSYYGETMLHFMDLRGETSTIVGKKEGTVSAAEWLPNNDGFIVIQGKMPALVTWYSNRAEPMFSFGELPVNGIQVNPFGTLLALTGFGNLSGNVYVWNLKTKSLISNFKAVDTTCYSWLADGIHMITATHYDRLKVANGFKVWNYLGSMIHQQDCIDDSQIQLYRIFPFDPAGRFDEPSLQAGIKGKILCEEPVHKYVPPSLRNKQSQSSRLIKPPPPKPSIKSLHQQSKTVADKDPQAIKAKKLKNLNKKLQQIEHLKKLQDEGKQLEKNQLGKIEKLDEIIKEIEMLKMEA